MTKSSVELLSAFLFAARVGRAKEIIDVKKIRSWRLLDDFRQRFAKVRASMPPPRDKRLGGPERLLLE